MADLTKQKLAAQISSLEEHELDHLEASLALEKAHFEERVQLLAGPFAKSIKVTSTVFCFAIGFALHEVLTSGTHVVEGLAAVVGLGVLTAIAAAAHSARRKLSDLERVVTTARGAKSDVQSSLQ